MSTMWLVFLGIAACRSSSEQDDSGPSTPDDSSPTDDSGPAPDDTDTPTDTGELVPTEPVWEDVDSPDSALTNVRIGKHQVLGTLVYVSWELSEPLQGRVEYSFDAGDWRSTADGAWKKGYNEALLLGIPYDETVSIRFVYDDAKKKSVTTGSLTTQTEPLPSGLPLPDVLSSDPDAWLPGGNYIVGSVNESEGGWTGGTYWKFIMDRQGRMVWAHPTRLEHWTIYMRVSQDGDDLMWEEQTHWAEWDQGAASKVWRTKIDLSVVASYNTPGLHHPWTELPDSTLVWGEVDTGSENLVKLEPGADEPETIWRCRDFHAAQGHKGSCQSNSLWWNEAEDTFLFSFYTSSTVVEIDHQTGDTLRIWGQTIPGSWGFDPEDSWFVWQHGVTYTDAGTLLLSTKDTTGSETVVREYELDDDDEVLREVWSFGIGEGIYGSTAGEAHRLSNGNTLHNYGSAAALREVTPAGEVVWDVDWKGNRLLGRTVFVEDLYAFAP